MSVDELKNKLSSLKEIKIKVYSLEYIIKEENEEVIIYPLLYSNKKSYYKNIDDLLNYYTIYNESIVDNLDRVSFVEGEN